MSILFRRGVAVAAVAAALSGVLSGCGAAAVPPELVDARRAYNDAQASPAASLEPGKLYEARKALNRAERAFKDDPEAQETRDLAYIAQRKAQRVEALGSINYASRQIVQARRDYLQAREALQGRQEQELSAQLSRAREQLLAGKEQLAVERSARVQAEERAKEAMNKLAEVAQVREVPNRGTVITLSGSVLFATNEATLLPIAQQRLAEVAAALKENAEQTIVVEGYTDSRGSASINQDLSLRRAQAVRDYLVSQGVPADRIRAVGRGAESPIADNATAEGRANNRRVEIVVQSTPTGADKASSPYD